MAYRYETGIELPRHAIIMRRLTNRVCFSIGPYATKALRSEHETRATSHLDRFSGAMLRSETSYFWSGSSWDRNSYARSHVDLRSTNRTKVIPLGSFSKLREK